MRRSSSAKVVIVVMQIVAAGSVSAQEAETVTLDYPGELPLAGLVDYAGQTLGVRILYSGDLQGKSITLRPAPVTMPRAALLEFVRSALGMHGLALVEDELEGFLRVVPLADVTRTAGAIRAAGDIRVAPVDGETAAGRVVTQLIPVPSGQTKRVAAHLQRFMSSAQASLIELPERGAMLVTDYEPVVARLVKLVELIDPAAASVQTRIVPASNVEPALLADQAKRVMEAQAPAIPGAAAAVQMLGDVIPGAVVVIGAEPAINEAVELIERLNRSAETSAVSRVYTPLHISADRLRTLIENLVTGPARENIHLFVDASTNSVHLIAPEAVHVRVAALLETWDVPLPPAQQRLRLYRPKHRSAGELLDTLTHLLEESTVALFETPAERDPVGTGRDEATAQRTPRQTPPVPPAPPIESASKTEAAASTTRRVEGPGYVLTEDAHTNAIIAVGSPEFHAQLATLLEELDRRRPQVFIEMTLVAVSLSDSADLGFELESLDLGDGFDYLLFSNFGLSEIDVATGQRVLAPGVGANGVIIGPDSVPLVLKALATHGQSRVMSMPRIVVADNTAGTIRSVDEAPFTSINASDTVATTSFAGFESAGTTLNVTPHIAEGEHVTLDYTLNFSNFTGAAAGATSPPPRTTNSFTGVVEIPDGHTVVVGGLVVDNDSDTLSGVPLLGRIPVLGLLFQNSSVSRTRSRIFAFIRPVILRDDQFADLKFITEFQLKKAELAHPDFPPDVEMWMR